MLPLFRGLGALDQGVSVLAKEIKDAKGKNEQLEKQKKHTFAMEEVSLSQWKKKKVGY